MKIKPGEDHSSAGNTSMEGYQKAIDLLYRTLTPAGFISAPDEKGHNHPIVTREAALCGLAALSTDDEELKQCFKNSIETIFRHQHKNGFIPNTIHPSSNGVSYGNAAGCVDNHAWIIISACTFACLQKEHQWLRKFRSAIDKAFALMASWEFNGRCLMYVPQSGGWADEYYPHGYILYNQLLRIWALRCAAKVFRNSTYGMKASRIRIAVENYFGGAEFYALQIERMWEGKQFPYWIMGFNGSALYTRFDLQANILALLLKTGTTGQQQNLVQYIRDLYAQQKAMVPSFTPPVTEDEPAMRELENSHAFQFRNKPYEFHNSGLWPAWNGLAAFSLSGYDRELSLNLSVAIEKACGQNNWEFNQCYHGKTNNGIGGQQCAWSAAGLILSRNTDFISKLVL